MLEIELGRDYLLQKEMAMMPLILTLLYGIKCMIWVFMDITILVKTQENIYQVIMLQV